MFNGGIPVGAVDLKDRFKLAVLERLNKLYGIVEEDLISAEIELVPAWKADDVGLDSSFVGGYGQDDRVCLHCPARCGRNGVPERTALSSAG